MERGEDVILTGGLQLIPRDPKDNGVVTMLVLLTKGANEKPFVYDHQHGGGDVTCKPRNKRTPGKNECVCACVK